MLVSRKGRRLSLSPSLGHSRSVNSPAVTSAIKPGARATQSFFLCCLLFKSSLLFSVSSGVFLCPLFVATLTSVGVCVGILISPE